MRPVFYERKLRPNYGISRKVFWRILQIALAAFVIYQIGGCVHRGIANREATRLVRLAGEDLARNDLEAARANLKVALALSPDHLDGARAAADLADREGDARALEYHAIVTANRRAATADFRRAAFSAAAHKNQSLSDKWAGRVAVLEDSPAFPDLIRARLFAARGEKFEQEKSLRAALNTSENVETLSALATFLLAGSDDLSLQAAETASLLRRIAEIDNGPKGLSALKTALQADLVEDAELASWLQRVRNHPAADEEACLFADGFAIKKNGDSSARVVESLVARQLRLPPAERLESARWLIDRGQAAKVWTLFSEEESLGNPEILRLRVEGGLDSGRYVEVEDFLSRSSNPLPVYETLALRAQAAARRGDEPSALQFWNSAFDAARQQPAASLDLLRRAAASKAWPVFYDELPALLHNPDWALKSVQTLLPVLRKHRDSEIMRDFYERTRKTRFLAREALPGDRYDYTCLILGNPVSSEQIEARVKKFPESVPLRITRSLDLLQQGAKVRALFELESTDSPVDFTQLETHQKAVVASILAANNRRPEAEALAAVLPIELLTVQEVAFLEKNLGSPVPSDSQPPPRGGE